MKKADKYLEALKNIDGWVTVSDWAKKFAEMYPDELAKAEHISLNRLFDELTTVVLVQFDAKTNFKLRADKFIVEIQEKLNHRPRKVLGYKTPHEVFFARIAEWIDDSKLYYKNSCVAVGG